MKFMHNDCELTEPDYTAYIDRWLYHNYITITTLISETHTQMYMHAYTTTYKHTCMVKDQVENQVKLKIYTGELVWILGTANVEVTHGETKHNLVIHGKGPNLMGRDWLSSLKLTIITCQQHLLCKV